VHSAEVPRDPHTASTTGAIGASSIEKLGAVTRIGFALRHTNAEFSLAFM